MQRVEITVYGSVQGVCFRYYTKEEAQKLGLTGYVRNVDSDKVEIVAEGHESALKDLIEFTRKGPSMANVVKQDVDYMPATGEFHEFRISY